MRWGASLLFLAGLLSAPPARAADPTTDARDVARAVLAMEARGVSQSARPSVCVELTVEAPRIRMQHPWRNPPREPRPPHFWSGDVSAVDGRIQTGTEVPPDVATRLFAAEAMAWSTSGQPPLLARIEPQWLAMPLVSCGENVMGLRLTSPVIVGDLAFIAVDYQCPLCGQGMLLVLERRASHWAVIATAFQWVS